jgi:hypothetical protein
VLAVKAVLSVSAVILCALSSACSRTPDVVVSDPAGVVIVGAKVEPLSPSLNHPAVTTNGKGEANIPRGIQDVKWLNVSAPGFTAVHVEYGNLKPQRVVLKP